MNKLILGLFLGLLYSSPLFAGPRDKEAIADIGPSNVTLTVSTNVVISAGGTGIYNCLDYIHTVSTASVSLYLLDGGTTIYYGRIPSSGFIPPQFVPALCGSANTNLTIKTSTITVGAEISLNYKGFKGK